MLLSFVRGGPWDLQRSYNGQSNAPFAAVFTRAASYALGLVGAAAGHSQTALMAGGGLHNLVVNPKTAGLNFGNNPKNPPFIAQGFRDYFGTVFAPPATIPPGTFQGNPAFSMPADRIKTAFDHSFNGLPDNFNRLVPSVINGNLAPDAGFGSHATTERRPSYSLPATIVTSTPTPPGSWLNSMIRNGELERIARSEGTSPLPMWRVTPAFEPDAVHSPDGYFVGNFPTAFPAIAPSTAVPSSRNAGSQDREGAFDTRFRNPDLFSWKHPRKRSIKSLGIRRGGASNPLSLFEDYPVVCQSSKLYRQRKRPFSPDTPGGPRWPARCSCRHRPGQADRDAADF